MNFLKIARVELKQLLSTRQARVALIVIILMPLLYSFVYLSAFWDPYGNLKNLPVAVVNLDRGYNDGKEKINAGKELVDELKSNNAVKWYFVEEKEAYRGLLGDKYYLIVKIPEDFSEKLYKMKSSDPQKTGIKVIYNEGKNYLAAQLNSRVVLELKQKIEGKIVKEAMTTLLEKMDDSLKDVEKAADGSEKLEGGIKQAYNGSTELAKGGQKLAAGAKKLAAGTEQLYQGSNRLKSGTMEFSRNMSVFAAKMEDVRRGSEKIYEGLKLLPGDELGGQFAELNGGVKTVADGAYGIYSGSLTLERGVANLAAGSSGYIAGVNSFLSGVESFWSQVSSGLKQLASGYNQLLDGLNKLKDSLQTGTTLVAGVDQSQKAAQNQIEQALNTLENYKANHPDPEIDKAINSLNAAKENLTMINQYNTGLSALVSKGNEGISELSSSLTTLNLGLTNLINQGEEGYKSKLKPGMVALEKGSQDLTAGFSQLQDGVGTLVYGSKKLSEGTDRLALKTREIPAKMEELGRGLSALKDGYNQLYNGINLLAEGSSKLNNAALALSNGTASLNSGILPVKNGALELEKGALRLSTGQAELNDGLFKLYKGSQELTSGLKAGVEEGKKELTPSLKEKRAKIISDPVEVKEEKKYYVPNYGTAFTPYFLPLSLWIGALVLFFLVNLKDHRLTLSSVRSWEILIGKFLAVALIGVLQAVISGIILEKGLDLQVASQWKFFGFAILMSLTFLAIIGLMVSLFGMAGRFLAVVLLILQLASCGGAFPFELLPKFFREISVYLPMTYGVYGLREAISGGSGMSFNHSVFMMALFGVIALILNYFVTPRHVRLSDLSPNEGNVI
ncbi:YhgE/Pip domain-containing protein [Carboxydothermus hydrogenoformans]|uniref:Phage infection protein n=1 Tax=Carboxydothermus hydrogenoformans (strain ATCC BAA-161 / DSM 6008 / Z-2901) TaxID=246194 RepID=Q3AER5_CARHZ|nr:YhgE/Pip domain-containing protein [Carboxydothermus hydrogenoformans]ABB15362.1 phage infection protein [Carboxydothermus hydrogenoformans Z-2901]